MKARFDTQRTDSTTYMESGAKHFVSISTVGWGGWAVKVSWLRSVSWWGGLRVVGICAVGGWGALWSETCSLAVCP